MVQLKVEDIFPVAELKDWDAHRPHDERTGTVRPAVAAWSGNFGSTAFKAFADVAADDGGVTLTYAELIKLLTDYANSLMLNVEMVEESIKEKTIGLIKESFQLAIGICKAVLSVGVETIFLVLDVAALVKSIAERAKSLERAKDVTDMITKFLGWVKFIGDKVKGQLRSDLSDDAIAFLTHLQQLSQAMVHRCDELKKLAKNDCFPSTSTVRRHDGKKVSVSELEIGDKVATGGQEDEYSEVIAFIHADAHAHNRFLSITFAGSNEHLRATPGHVVFASSNADSPFVDMLAGELCVGMYMRRRDEVSDRIRRYCITNISETESYGVYAPLTAAGTVEVDSVSVSCYAYVSHTKAHCAFLPFRMAHSAGLVTASECQGILPYAQFLIDVHSILHQSKPWWEQENLNRQAPAVAVSVLPLPLASN